MKASYLFKHNIESLLRRRGQSQHDLALWCRRTDAWLSKILGKDDRNLPMKYLDRIADFFGLAVYQLFQPGISPLTERRHGTDRRSGRERRIGHVAQLATAQSSLRSEDAAFLRDVNGLSVENRRKVEHWIAVTKLGQDRASGQAPQPDQPLTAAAPGEKSPSRQKAPPRTTRA